MQKHQLQKPRGLKKSVRIARGGKRGKTSGKGMKGQKARTGNSTRPEMRDIIKKLPKRRGHGVNRSRTVVPKVSDSAVNLDQLERLFESGAEVSPKTIVEKGLASRVSGKLPKVKVLARGEIKKKLNFTRVSVSGAAKEAILKAGGTIA